MRLRLGVPFRRRRRLDDDSHFDDGQPEQSDAGEPTAPFLAEPARQLDVDAEHGPHCEQREAAEPYSHRDDS